MSVKVVTDRVADVISAVKYLTSRQVMVGVPQDTSVRNAQDGISNAALGYIHENGAPEVGIPARPHLVPGVNSVKDAIAEDFKAAGVAALDGNAAAADRGLHRAGLRASAAVKKKIQDGPFVPLKPGTIAGRLRRGRTGTRPLIDTGALRNSYTYVIREK